MQPDRGSGSALLRAGTSRRRRPPRRERARVAPIAWHHRRSRLAAHWAATARRQPCLRRSRRLLARQCRRCAGGCDVTRFDGSPASGGWLRRIGGVGTGPTGPAEGAIVEEQPVGCVSPAPQPRRGYPARSCAPASQKPGFCGRRTPAADAAGQPWVIGTRLSPANSGPVSRKSPGDGASVSFA